ncbi:hypothetical protein BDK51DRAFT_46364 [Blyttiomyces helicus]|uniref:Uncharacterized protein n=1 Tax=Blyttiomyces helicus TaxID=388810 RepID=A0A4P9WE96_9FUNG|nr:hypothetical protein BDK51DRAFT_46364 [Blyttiomyces helicus]|eukprot:RKO90712.1 hypothetical protein BDK51DRAFT_46364 [Blyttiomyces helicus]
MRGQVPRSNSSSSTYPSSKAPTPLIDRSGTILTPTLLHSKSLRTPPTKPTFDRIGSNQIKGKVEGWSIATDPLQYHIAILVEPLRQLRFGSTAWGRRGVEVAETTTNWPPSQGLPRGPRHPQVAASAVSATSPSRRAPLSEKASFTRSPIVKSRKLIPPRKSFATENLLQQSQRQRQGLHLLYSNTNTKKSINANIQSKRLCMPGDDDNNNANDNYDDHHNHHHRNDEHNGNDNNLMGNCDNNENDCDKDNDKVNHKDNYNDNNNNTKDNNNSEPRHQEATGSLTWCHDPEPRYKS